MSRTRSLLMPLGETRPASPQQNTPWQLTQSLSAADIGGTLFLKLCGFIQDQQARIVDVGEDYYRLRIGYTRLERFWHGLSGHGPLDVTLNVDRTEEEKRDAFARRATTAIIRVDVRPLGRGWNAERFADCSQRLIQRLRLHLMAG